MAILRARRKLILAKVESTYGTLEVATAMDAMLVSNVTLTPVTGGTADRELIRPYFGSSAQIPINTHATLEFAVEIAGPGGDTAAAILAPAWGRLLQACGMSQAIGKKAQADPRENKVTYTPDTDSAASLTIVCNQDGQQHILTGARGTFRVSIAGSAIPRFIFTFTGLWNAPSSVDAIDPDYSKWQAPLPGSRQNTPAASFFGADRRMGSFEMDWGAEVNHREIIGGANEVIITDRQPSGTIVLDAVALSTFNPFALAQAGTTGALRIVHGGPDTNASAYKLVEINCPKVQLGEPEYGDDSGVAQFNIPFRALPLGGSGDDEFTVVAR